MNLNDMLKVSLKTLKEMLNDRGLNIDNLNSLSEKNLFMRGLRSWVGFRQTGVEYERDERHAGKTNFCRKRFKR